jgi:hypothetical protein
MSRLAGPILPSFFAPVFAPVFVLVLAPVALAQPLWSNGSPDPAVPAFATSSRSFSGVAAPAGRLFAEVGGSSGDVNLLAGLNVSPDPGAIGGAFRVADDFTISHEFGWRLDSVTVFVYVNGSAPPGASPFSGATLRLWDSNPAGAETHVFYGDAVRNRLLAVRPTNLLRIFSTRPLVPTNYVTPPDASRRIWALELDLGGYTYMPATYWLDVQVQCVDPSVQAWIVPVTREGARSRPDDNAMALVPDGLADAWVPVVDPGKSMLSVAVPQDIAFILNGQAAGVCPADFNQDGGVDGDDMTAFFAAWESGEMIADVNADGGIDGDDVTTFFHAWEAGGC